MIRFDLNMEHDEVHGKFVLTVCICSICIFIGSPKGCSKIRTPAEAYCLHILYNICKQYASAGVRILLQAFGLPMVFLQKSFRLQKDSASLFTRGMIILEFYIKLF